MRKILCFLLVPLLLAAPVLAADSGKSLQNEIIYRVHLGRADDVTLLLKQGASPNLTNTEGIPLIALAAGRTDQQAIPVINALLADGADINAQDTTGQTALFHAARINNTPIVKHLMTKGIDYYIVDNNGDVARNIAHKEGYDGLVAVMDEFVVGQSKKVQQQYEEYNKTLQQQYDEQRRIIEEYEANQRALDDEEYYSAVLMNEEMEAEYENALQEMERIKAAQQQAIIKKREDPAFEENLRKLAYHMCGFQYWSYCRSLNQTTELKGDALDGEIDMHFTKVVELSAFLEKEYQLDKPYINGVSERGQKRIFYEMDRMPSKTYRFQQGIGKTHDMNRRCQRVAKYWNVELTPEEKGENKKKKKKKGYSSITGDDES